MGSTGDDHQASSPAVPANLLTMFARREAGTPRCIRCGQRFHLFFSGGRLAEQRCGCGLVYRVQAMVIDQFLGDDDAIQLSGRDGAEPKS
jgi:hypothetical protein